MMANISTCKSAVGNCQKYSRRTPQIIYLNRLSNADSSTRIGLIEVTEKLVFATNFPQTSNLNFTIFHYGYYHVKYLDF